ncbi:MAG: transcription termination factor Rho [Chloroflexi bacterium]|nr:transcription termination factor Rho [Chloroflexota bacterium]
MPDPINGILKRMPKGAYVLYNPAKPSAEVVYVPATLIEQHKLVEGAFVGGAAQRGRQGLELASVDAVCGLKPAAYLKRKPFTALVPVDPSDRFNLSVEGDTSMRIVDLIAPIAKGTRGLIVAPPKAGKTMLLEKIAKAIHAAEPKTRIIALLIDERPEEVTYFRRAAQAEVFASSSDQQPQEHVALSELMLAHIRTELECGHHVVVLLDSLTRLVRAFNLKGGGTGRTLSGGVEAGALEIPRRFFGLARNIEKGGSITIVASILVDTGSRMDQLIYEEFKSTGNSEIVLDRQLAEARIYPAIQLAASSTRKAERLYGAEENTSLMVLRRALAARKPMESMRFLLKLLDKYPTNEALLRSIPLEG